LHINNKSSNSQLLYM